MFGPLVDAPTLMRWLQIGNDPESAGNSSPPGPLRIVDCRADLSDPDAGRKAFEAGHIIGAVFADLEKDMSGPPVTNRGRHPLPTDEALAALLGRLAIDSETCVIAYDAHGGAFAARLWWLARYAGVARVAVLDGGLPAWQAVGGVLETGAVTVSPAVSPVTFGPVAAAMPVVGIEDLDPSTMTLVDAREPRRYRGEFEPIDPVGGHIPGAFNHPFATNLEENGCFKSPDRLLASFRTALGRLPDDETVHYCGSGVTGCHNVLAQEVAGLPTPKLYAGSFSEWCRTDGCVVETGVRGGGAADAP